MKPSSILTSDSFILHFSNGVTKSVARTDPKFNQVKAMMIKDHPATETDILTLLDPVAFIKRHSSGLFDVNRNGVVIDGVQTPTLFSTRALEIAEAGLDASPLVAFWRNLQSNPDPRAKTDLYGFLEKQGHPITQDGCFLAYKKIDKDYMSISADKQTGVKNSNKIGEVVIMDRAKVDSNPNQTCSYGLHVANLNYAKDFSGHRLVVVKVNPRDVVAIPTDYNGEKMRVCRYQVISEMQEATILTSPIVDTSNENWMTQKRDSKGRFLPK
jgi:hypothetical protein